MRERRYYVYIMAGKSRVIYVGVTGFLMARVLHKAEEGGAITLKYQVHRLVYFHSFQNVGDAIARERRRLRNGGGRKKVALIHAENPTWGDLGAGWGDKAVMKVSAQAGSSSGFQPDSE